MKTIIHDLDNDLLSNLDINDNYYVINACKCKNRCIGCFSCWIKHPKRCMYNDEFSNITDMLNKSCELIIISKYRYGCYSMEVKRVFERCIGYVLPYFCVRNNMIHHMPRYKNKLKFKVIFYGEVNDNEKNIVNDLVVANGINLDACKCEIIYVNNEEEINKCIH